jgi:hypothetical protein
MRLAYITQKQAFVQVELVLWQPVKSVQVAPVSPSQYSVQQFEIADVASLQHVLKLEGFVQEVES